jgi:hypothetical protein
MEWPSWWDWELEFSSHANKRMAERLLSEAALRAMLEDARQIVEQGHGTFVVQAYDGRVRWEIIVAPDYAKRVIVVVTAYPDPE